LRKLAVSRHHAISGIQRGFPFAGVQITIPSALVKTRFELQPPEIAGNQLSGTGSPANTYAGRTRDNVQNCTYRAEISGNTRSLSGPDERRYAVFVQKSPAIARVSRTMAGMSSHKG
jgi:hypothetical protein